MKTLISVIIPSYNMDIYLGRCLTSIINQTYRNIEIIVVDDGSIDNTASVCKTFCEKDSRIIVHKKKNGGVSSARNYGFEKSTGKYVCFIDADDFIEPEYIETLYNMCIDYDCDIAQCRFQMTASSNYFNVCTKNQVETFTGIQMIGNIYNQLYVQSIVAFNKLYKRELFKIVRYPEGLIHEDEATTPLLFYYSKKVAVTDKIMYHYFKNSLSITRGAYTKQQLDTIDAIGLRADFFKNNNLENYYSKDCYIFLTKILIQYYKANKYLVSGKEDVKFELKERFLAEYKNMDRSKWRKARRLLLFICCYFPMFYAGFYLKIKKKFKNIDEEI